jgi:hypothetical protein
MNLPAYSDTCKSRMNKIIDLTGILSVVTLTSDGE